MAVCCTCYKELKAKKPRVCPRCRTRFDTTKEPQKIPLEMVWAGQLYYKGMQQIRREQDKLCLAEIERCVNDCSA
jgi:hypothetical protein